MKFLSKPERFWSEIYKVEGSAMPYVLRRTLVFGLIAFLVTLVEKHPAFPNVAIPMAPYEVLGAPWGPCWSSGPMPDTSGGGRAASSGEGSSTSAATW